MKFIKRISLTLFILFTLTAIGLLYGYFNNFYTIIPDTIYRSRQLNKAQFEKYLQAYHIRSVLNLRGEHLHDQWYLDEILTTKNNRAMHYDLGLLSTQLPTSTDIQTLVHIIDNAPKPLLIHCESGVDRTGLASAIALILANHPIAQIKAQTSMHYFVISKKSVGKQFLRLYVSWLDKNKLPSSRDNLFKFLQKEYPHD